MDEIPFITPDTVFALKTTERTIYLILQLTNIQKHQQTEYIKNFLTNSIEDSINTLQTLKKELKL